MMPPRTGSGASAIAGRPEIWGGIECTLNRVGERYLDQFRLQGHDRRPEDIDRIAGLGIRTLRYPVHWERVEPLHPDQEEWFFCDERLGRIRALGLAPIVGLLHHGSGPRWTGLLDPISLGKPPVSPRAWPGAIPGLKRTLRSMSRSPPPASPVCTGIGIPMAGTIGASYAHW